MEGKMAIGKVARSSAPMRYSMARLLFAQSSYSGVRIGSKAADRSVKIDEKWQNATVYEGMLGRVFECVGMYIS
jgi:hypothetical protein